MDRDLLRTGKLALRLCSGIMPDGAPFHLPDQADVPPPLELNESIENAVVYLALAVQNPRKTSKPSAGPDPAGKRQDRDSLARREAI